MASKDDETNGLGFIGLTTLVVTACVGAGIFSLPGDLATGGANTGAILVGWVVCLVGVLALAKTFSGLAAIRPEMSGGIYVYAREGFGDFAGFASAWGYWFCSCLSNAGDALMLLNALSFFLPQLGGVNSPASFVLISCLLWLLAFLLTRGMTLATGVNTVVTLAKLVPLVLFVLCVALLARFDLATFAANFWSEPGGPSIVDQFRSTMDRLVWLFVGLEGAVVVSGRARDARDVGRATTFGFVLVVILYVAISLLSLGVMGRGELARLSTPSLAGVFELVIGPVGAALVNVGVMVSLMATMLGYLTFAAETAFQAARSGIFPGWLARTNAEGTAVVSTVVSAAITQAILVISLFSSGTYQLFSSCAVYAILIPYACAAGYYAVAAWRCDRIEGELAPRVGPAQLAGTVALAYTLSLIWGSGLRSVMVIAVVIAPGTLLHLVRCALHHENPLPTPVDKVLCALVGVAVVVTALTCLA